MTRFIALLSHHDDDEITVYCISLMKIHTSDVRQKRTILVTNQNVHLPVGPYSAYKRPDMH